LTSREVERLRPPDRPLGPNDDRALATIIVKTLIGWTVVSSSAYPRGRTVRPAPVRGSGDGAGRLLE
jgi:hypothetical protein